MDTGNYTLYVNRPEKVFPAVRLSARRPALKDVNYTRVPRYRCEKPETRHATPGKSDRNKTIRRTYVLRPVGRAGATHRRNT